MKTINLFILLLFFASTAFAMDEADIPPPPMPEYMKKHQVKMETQDTSFKGGDLEETSDEVAETSDEEMDREVASEPAVNLGGQSEEDIKHEFLQAGEENEDVPEDMAVQEVQEGSIEEAAEKEMAEKPIPDLYEEPTGKVPAEEVSEVQESEKEFEQAAMEKTPMPPPVEVVDQPNPTEPAADKLAEVEQTLEAAEVEAEARLDNGRKPSSKKKFKAGMYKFDDKCVMHKEPSSMSDTAGSIRAGRKLWIDPHNESWHKAYKKSGTVYISADCIP